MPSQTHLKQWQIALIVAGALAVTSVVLVSPDPFFWLAGLALGEAHHCVTLHPKQHANDERSMHLMLIGRDLTCDSLELLYTTVR